MSEKFYAHKANVIESSEGFAVEVLGRTGLRYTEGGKTLFVDSEVLATGFGIMVIANSIQKWESPSAGQSDIGRGEQVRIIENIQRALTSQGHPVDVQPENWRVA